MKSFLKTAIATAALALMANAYAAKTHPTTTTSNTASSPDRAKIESIVHDYLLNNPDVVIQAVQNYQRKQYEQAEETIKQTQKMAPTFADALFHQNNDPAIGNPNGKVTVVEFFDYQCPHCVDMAPVISAISKANPDVRIVFKDFPIRGPMSEVAARAAIAANKQGKYYDFSHALLIANKQLTEDAIYDIAKSVGLDVDKLKKDMKDASVTDVLNANMKLAQNLKLFGTPAFFIGKTNDTKDISYVPGQMDQNQLQTAIDKASQ